jgi:hypothetical protein
MRLPVWISEKVERGKELGHAPRFRATASRRVSACVEEGRSMASVYVYRKTSPKKTRVRN